MGSPHNCPDDSCLDANGKDIVFIHGYNVNGQQARGWQSEMFKRLYWAGSKARFWGLTWYGANDQINSTVTLNFQVNVWSALHSAPEFRRFLNMEMNGPVTLVAHSLGCMLGSSALLDPGEPLTASIDNVFMIDAAVALEAFTGELEGGGDPDAPDGDVNYSGGNDPAAFTEANPMTHPDWYHYAKKLGASEWYKHFVGNVAIGGGIDERQKLTLRGRFANLGANFYNFYSEGEEVLGTHHGGLKVFEDGYAAYADGGRNTWVLQEKLKGRMLATNQGGSQYGGWGFNYDDDAYWRWAIPLLNKEPILPNDDNGTPGANSIPWEQLKTRPFFDWGRASPLTEPGGSSWAAANRDQLLAQAIPAMTLPTGGPGGEEMLKNLPPENVRNMQTAFTNDWPEERIREEKEGWRHSDLRNVAYLYIFRIYNAFLSPTE